MAKKRTAPQNPRRRFLAKAARRGTDPNILGYLDEPARPLVGTLHHVDTPDTIERIADATALCDEPECIGDAVISYAETNRKYDTLRRAREIEDARETRTELTLEQRIVTARARAKQQRVDVALRLGMVERALTGARKGGRDLPAGQLKRLEEIEALLDGAATVERELGKAA